MQNHVRALITQCTTSGAAVGRRLRHGQGVALQLLPFVAVSVRQ